MKRHRVDFLPSTGLHEEPELWHQQWRRASIRLLGECRQIWLSLCWFLDLLYWLRVWVYLAVEQFTCPPPSRKDTEGWGKRVEHPGHTHSRSRHWGGLSWNIPRNYHPVKGYWVGRAGGRLKDARGMAHPMKRYWWGRLIWEKIEEYLGLGWMIPRSLCFRGLEGLCWMGK